MKYYLILSTGEYSDYSPEYFVGDREITQDEFEQKAKEIGDLCFAEWEALPERPHKCTGDWCCGFEKEKPTEKYNLETGKTVRSPFSDDNKWFTRMKTWIASQGFSPLPEDIPEINIAYSDYPTSNGERSDYSKDFTS